jgi:hypothetical protein
LTRLQFIEQTLRQIYGSQPSDDSDITPNLVNQWLDSAIAIAAKNNYVDNLKMDGVGYINNSFYTQFKNIPVAKDEEFTYKLTLPQIPFGIGSSEGLSTLQFIDSDGHVSLPCVPLSENQVSIFERMRPVQGKILYYSEGQFVYVKTTLLLDQYTAKARMVSGGDGMDLGSTLNVPADYFPAMSEYLQKQLAFQRTQIVDAANDGQSAIRTA